MRKLIFFSCFLLLVTLFSCVRNDENPDIKVHWKHFTNFTDEPGVFESSFILYHQNGFSLDGSNWALFFNMAPRTIVETNTPQPASIEHLNGDWYRMAPSKDFHLSQGDSITINYRGIESVIKESDRPLGLYFVYYDENGDEKEIVEVADYSYTAFTEQDQINRSPEDYDPVPTPEFLYKSNQKLSKLPGEELDLIVPTPVKMIKKEGFLTFNEEFKITYDENTKSEAQFLQDKLSNDIGISLTLSQSDPGPKKITLRIGDVTVAGNTKEAYKLTINPDGISIVGSDQAGVFYGIQSLRAMLPLEAFQNPGQPFTLNYREVSDAPRFGFRSLHLDVGRNFQTKEAILKLLDAMAFYKLNHFLFYVTEDEGWRLEIEGLPELTDVGAVRQHTNSFKNSTLHPAYGSGPFANDPDKYGSGHYSKEDFIEILQYAQKRHITVIPEVNFPGHARAAIKAMEYRYERLMKEGKPEEANEYRLIDPDDTSKYISAQSYKDNVVCVVKEEAYHFYEKVVTEILQMYKEAGVPISKFHMGGDEVPTGAWTGSPLVVDFMKNHPEIENHHALHAYFVKTMTERLSHLDLEWHGWEEVALKKSEGSHYKPNPEFVGKKVVPYIWNNLFDYPDIGYQLANAGYPVVLCNVSNFYFDLAYNKDPKEPGLYWAGFINERDSWTFAPFNMFRTTLNTSSGQGIHVLRTEQRGDEKVDIVKIEPGDQPGLELERLNPEARPNIVGIEAQIWSETIKGQDMLEYYYLPKLIGFAESAWTKERSWENTDDEESRISAQQKEWNVFANLLAQKELPRFHYLNNGYNYRIPPPGAIIEDGFLKANVEYPGLHVYYTIDGSEPNKNSQLFSEPVPLEGKTTIKLKCIDMAGNESRTVEIEN